MNMNKKKMMAQTISKDFSRRDIVRERLLYSAAHDDLLLYSKLGTSEKGLTDNLVAEARDTYGKNIVAHGRRETLFQRICKAFVNPFTAILFVLALVSTFTDIVLAAPHEKSYVTVTIITIMVMISGLLRFVQETRSGNAAAKLSKMIHTTTCLERWENGKQEIPLEEVVVGDMVHLCAGDMVPADLRILSAKDLFISQSALTGESEPVEKHWNTVLQEQVLTEIPNLAFMGSNVISGSAKAVAIAVGDDTLLGGMAKELMGKPPKTSFEKGVNSVSWVLIRFMLIMVPIVLFINGITKGDWLDASLFAISVAVGLTPEMLPMIVTTSLAKGAVAMSKKKVIIKNLNAI